MKRYIISGTAILVVLGLSGFALLRSTKSKAPSSQVQSYTLHSKRTSGFHGGSSNDGTTIVRYVRGDGAWKEVKTRDGNAYDVTFGVPGTGVFTINEQSRELVYLSPMSVDRAKGAPSINQQTAGSILGIPTVISRTDLADGAYTEVHFAPGLSYAILKRVFSNKTTFNVVEATSIVLGEPAAAEFDTLPSYPVSYAFYQQRLNDQK